MMPPLPVVADAPGPSRLNHVSIVNVVTPSDGAAPNVTRQRKWDGLLELEQLGLIKIERRRRKSPLVTVLVEPES